MTSRRRSSRSRRRDRGANGRIWPGHWLPCGPESMLKIWLEWASGSTEFQGKNSASAL